MKKFLALLTALTASAALAVGVNASSTALTVQNAAGNSGACTANSCATAVLQSAAGTIFSPSWSVQNTVSINVAGTFSATLTFQSSFDEGATWNNQPCLPAITSATNLTPLPVTSTTGTGNWQCDVGGSTTFRVVASTYSSGTATVILESYAAIGNETVGALPILTDSQQRPVMGASSGVSYNMSNAEAVGSSAKALAAVEADGTNRLYLRQLTICLDPTALQTTAGPRTIVVYPTTAASASGSTATPIALDAASAAFGGIARTGALTTTPAIGSVTTATALDAFSIFMPAAATALVPGLCVDRVYDGTRGLQPLAVAKGVANGFAVGDLTGGSGAAGNYTISMKFSAEPK